MKAFIIKNKEGKYFQWLFNYEPDWEDKLYNSFMHYSKEDAEKSIIQWQLEDCEVIEITIAEGDLEKENRVLKSKLYEMWYNFATIGEVCVTESKKEISSENAVEEIRNYLTDIDLCFAEIKEKLGTDYFIKQAKEEK